VLLTASAPKLWQNATQHRRQTQKRKGDKNEAIIRRGDKNDDNYDDKEMQYNDGDTAAENETTIKIIIYTNAA
jgi:hypothetical protein